MKAEVVNYVLKKPSAEHRDAIDKASEQSLKALDFLLAGEMDKALAIVHAGVQRPKPPKPSEPPEPPNPPSAPPAEKSEVAPLPDEGELP